MYGRSSTWGIVVVYGLDCHGLMLRLLCFFVKGNFYAMIQLADVPWSSAYKLFALPSSV